MQTYYLYSDVAVDWICIICVYTFILITEVVQSFKMHVDHSAYYDLEGCDTLSIAEIKNKITARIESATQQLTCVTSNICTMSTNDVINCDISRKKRDTNNFVGFTLTLSCDTTTRR